MHRIPGLSEKKQIAKPRAKVRKAPSAGTPGAGTPGTGSPATRATKLAPMGPKAEYIEYKYAHEALAAHFPGSRRRDIVCATRMFPAQMRAEVQSVFDRLYLPGAEHVHGVLERYRYEELGFSMLFDTDLQYANRLSPLTFGEVDIGEKRPMRCLENALLLCRHRNAAGDMPFALFVFGYRQPESGNVVRVEVAVPATKAGRALGDECMNAFDLAIAEAGTYRGKILSLEREDSYRGQAAGIRVHRLSKVAEDELVLPANTLRQLRRNVVDFMHARRGLRDLGLSTKKGILLYGPPGTGKTHTIRYLAGSLKDHTTILITAGQVGMLGAYMSLARLVQPAMVVIEDVDLIARNRDTMRGDCGETILNRLLNEMDGLQENADILFVLTTNRPHDLEAAIRDRPGRIDQAIEIPLPDSPCREKLIRLYGRRMKLSADLVAMAATRTEGASAAFIKELMRRTAQTVIARASKQPTEADMAEALDDMLFSGGTLNVKLLGGVEA